MDLIRAKRGGETLAAEDIRAFALGAARGEIPDYQVTAFLMAVFFRGMNAAETSALTLAMRDSGDRVVFDPALPTVDKHSTGGVGDKVSISLAPIVAACGGVVPMIAGRGLGHTGGTIDKLEAIPGFRTALGLDEFRRIVDTVGCAIGGQTERLCPADRRLYALRDVTATVECVPLIVSSILSKKSAEGVRALVMDVKCGGGAFMESEAEATVLARALCDTGREMGLAVRALVTDMSRPLGRTVGNALETAEAIRYLHGDADPAYEEINLLLAAHMLQLAGVLPNLESARTAAKEAVSSGRALAKLRDMIAAQGGDARVADDPSRLPRAGHVVALLAETDGFIESIATRGVGVAAMELGAGRRTAEDVIDPAVGFVLRKTVGDAVTRGEPILDIHVSDDSRLATVEERLRAAYRIGPERVSPPALVKGIVAHAGDLRA